MTAPTLDFTLEEYQRRIAAVRKEMANRGIEILLVDQLDHVAYLFGYLPTAARYQACLLPLEGDPLMVLRALDEPTFLDQSWVRSYVTFTDDEDAVALMTSEIERLAGAQVRLGIETDSNLMTVQRYQQIEFALPAARIVAFPLFIWELRLTKSEAELAYLRRAADIADRSLDRAIAAAVEGVSERVPAAAGYAAALELGADNGRVLLLACGRLSDTLHGRLADHKLAAGDILHLEFVPQVHGYSARIMRPTVIGEPSRTQQRTVDKLIAIQDEQLAAMMPGACAGDVDRIGREQVLKAGLRTDYPHVTGYTVGYHAQPRTSDHTRVFVPSARWQLAPGMVFHMYLSAGGMAISETVLVGQHGPERLTHTARKLFSR